MACEILGTRQSEALHRTTSSVMVVCIEEWYKWLNEAFFLDESANAPQENWLPYIVHPRGFLYTCQTAKKTSQSFETTLALEIGEVEPDCLS